MASEPMELRPTDIRMRDFRKSLPMALLRAREAVMNEFRPSLAEHDLNEQQWRVLRALSWHDAEPISVGELAERTLLLGPSLSRILVRLEELGYVKRKVDLDDARRSYLTVTRKGVTVVQRVAPSSEAIYGGIEQRFGAERLTFLINELLELADQEEAYAAELAHHDGEPRRRMKRNAS
jgi:homoprotocatechuate degradation regulator HpaR